jgi:hypothetical protein
VENERLGFKRRIREWLDAAGQQEVVELEKRIKMVNQESADRLAKIQSSLIDQDRWEDLSVDVRRRLAQLELDHREIRNGRSEQKIASGVIIRLGVRMTLADGIWGQLGIVSPGDLTDAHLDRLLQGPFCRNCLRSLVVVDTNFRERQVRFKCHNCSLTWNKNSETSTMSLAQLKRVVFEQLDAEYRKSGGISV